MPDMYTEEYANWKEEYQQQSLDLLADVRYSLGQSPDQRQRMEYARSTMAGVDKKLLKQEADKFILRQKLDKVANAYSVPGKIEEIKQVAKIQGVEINTFELPNPCKRWMPAKIRALSIMIGLRPRKKLKTILIQTAQRKKKLLPAIHF